VGVVGVVEMSPRVKGITVLLTARKVANENLKNVGIVFNVFDPTSSPYVAVKHTLITHPQNS
jgi:rRNA processing protein Gar1